MTRSRLLILALLTTTLATACSNDESSEPMQGEQPPASVTTTTVAEEDVKQFRHYTGRVQGSRAIEVRARVGGILEQRLYEEGEVIEAGAPLFRIDRRPLRIALDNARANAATARTTLEQAERERDRAQRLYERDAVSERERDDVRTAVKLAEAGLAAARAAVNEAELNLEYSEVTAPISGVTGQEVVSEGSLVEYGSLLTHITQMDPVYVEFPVPADDAGRIRQQRNPDDANTTTVDAMLPDGSPHEQAGTLNFTGSRIDPATNTLPMRATFPNADNRLLPGQLLRIRLPLRTFEDAVLIDPTALSEGPDGPQVFLRSGDTARSVNVTPGPIVEGQQVITEGLEAGDELIINGHVMLQDGGAVVLRDRQQGGE
ncbi:MAG: efflux RND transporter periplasmic adaptor subunit [Pseudohongiellaceae bacterium]